MHGIHYNPHSQGVEILHQTIKDLLYSMLSEEKNQLEIK